jgi:hypothetical protein
MLGMCLTKACLDSLTSLKFIFGTNVGITATHSPLVVLSASSLYSPASFYSLFKFNVMGNLTTGSLFKALAGAWVSLVQLRSTYKIFKLSLKA